MESDDGNFGPTEIKPMGRTGAELVASPLTPDTAHHGTDVGLDDPPRSDPDPRAWAEAQDHIDRIVDQAADWNVESNFFGTQERKLNSALNRVYPLFLVLAYRGEDAVAALKKHPSFASRLRGPNLGNPALAALELMLQPDNTDQRKTCSEYACKLIWANELRILPESFQARCTEVSLREAKVFARELRRKQKCLETGLASPCQLKVTVIAEGIAGKKAFFGQLNEIQYRALMQIDRTKIDSQSVDEIIDALESRR